jgi:hypothetical protein
MFVVIVGRLPLLSTARAGSGRVRVLYFLPTSVPYVAEDGQVICGASLSIEKGEGKDKKWRQNSPEKKFVQTSVNSSYLYKMHPRQTKPRYLNTFWLDYSQFLCIPPIQNIQEYSGNYTSVVDHTVLCPTFQCQGLEVLDSGPL